jgi:hypothetical protein
MQVTYNVLKEFAQSRSLSIQYVDIGNKYWLVAFDGAFSLETSLDKITEVDLVTDFETNYKANGNKKLDPRDSDGSPLQRTKITTTGWHYQLHGIEFETSVKDSNYSKKVDGTNYGFTSMKFYKDVSGTETEITGSDLNQTYLDANCIKTVIDWEPAHDLEVIGGMLKQQGTPSEDVRLWVIGVPDVSEAYGGSKPFVVNTNLKYIGIEEGVKVDGRAPKYMTYSSTYHTTKLRLMFRHSAGFKHKMHMIFELFKA